MLIPGPHTQTVEFSSFGGGTGELYFVELQADLPYMIHLIKAC